VGSVIGKGGQIVKSIREETNSKIRVCEGILQCDDRVIVIAAREDAADESEDSNAQVALLKVHDRLVEAEEGAQGLMTRMLVCHTQAGCIIGKGGKIIRDIRESSGANIKILTENELPICALHNDRVVQIMGEPGALNKALRLVSKQIRDNPSKERPGGATPQLLSMLQSGTAGGPPPQYGGGPPQGYRPQYQR
jgi:poly(rC)-binding protein 2/3/4